MLSLFKNQSHLLQPELRPVLQPNLPLLWRWPQLPVPFPATVSCLAVVAGADAFLARNTSRGAVPIPAVFASGVAGIRIDGIVPSPLPATSVPVVTGSYASYCDGGVSVLIFLSSEPPLPVRGRPFRSNPPSLPRDDRYLQSDVSTELLEPKWLR